MTTKAQLTQLAERVMALSGPDREVDAEIAAAVRYFPKGVGYVWQSELSANSPEKGRVECCTSVGTGGPHYAAPAYTASLDAAMSLAGDRFGSLIVGRFPDGRVGYVSRVGGQDAESETAPNAVTAAALLARAAECGE